MPDKNFETLPGTGLEQLFQEMLRKEDYRVFEKFFNYFYNPLCSYALKFVSSSPLAEDIVSDVFFKIWKIVKRLLSKHLYRPIFLLPLKINPWTILKVNCQKISQEMRQSCLLNQILILRKSVPLQRIARKG